MVKVKRKIEWIEGGLFHSNYRFFIEGNGLTNEWKDKPLLLRLISQKDTGRSQYNSLNHLNCEAKTLQVLKEAGFRFSTPEFICMVKDDSGETVGLIETWVWGISLPFYKKSIHYDRIVPSIAEAAVAVHQLPKDKFKHLQMYPDSRTHVLKLLGSLPPEVFSQYPAAHRTRDWILSHLPEKRHATVLHGDLLPQNLICGENRGEWKISVIDWEFAIIGDPACDLAVVTRGHKKLEGKDNGLKLLLNFYKEAGGAELSMSDIHIHELIMILNWLWDSAEAKRKDRHGGGHGPEFYLQRLESLLHRAERSR
ncbi:MAG: aminoglycoside phosphotransferase family protein [Proteobacteria bacterium]|nr:aminoglycoside phosphotransferase family protein [Pseudomonadota bacterium]